MEHVSSHAVFGMLLIAYGVVSVVAAKPRSRWGERWYAPEVELPGFTLLMELQGFVAVLAGVALALGWQAFGLADRLPF